VGKWTFQVFGEPAALASGERDAVASEIGRLRSLMRGSPQNGHVRVTQNPAGLVGEYASLLIEATVRGYPAEEIVPTDIARRYGDCHWFAVSREVLAGFREQWAAVRAEAADPVPAPSCS
jgi:hypothetical protein